MGSSSTPTAITDAEKASAQANTQAPTPPAPETPAADNGAGEALGSGGPVLDDLHKLLDDTKAATNQTQVHELVEKIRQWVKENL